MLNPHIEAASKQYYTERIFAMTDGICRTIRNGSETTYSFDEKKLVVTDAKKLSKGKFCNVRYAGGSLIMESSTVHCPMGCSSFEDTTKKTLFFSCRDYDNNGEVGAFTSALERLQDKVIDKATESKLLGDGKSRDAVSAIMSPFLKPSDSYPPAFRVTLPYSSDGSAEFETFRLDDGKATPCDFDSIDTRGASCKVIFTISSVWVVNKTWGMSAKAKQLLVKPAFDCPSAGMCCFSDVSLSAPDSTPARREDVSDDED